MRLAIASTFLSASLFAVTDASSGLRGRQQKANLDQRVLQEPERGPYHYKLSQQEFTNQTDGKLRINPNDMFANDLPWNLNFGEVHIKPGAVRDLHWYVLSCH